MLKLGFRNCFTDCWHAYSVSTSVLGDWNVSVNKTDPWTDGAYTLTGGLLKRELLTCEGTIRSTLFNAIDVDHRGKRYLNPARRVWRV